jgi:hypothetical protein
MWRETGPNTQNLSLILMALLMSLALGVGIPLLQSGPSTRQQHATWSASSPTPTVSDTATGEASSAAADGFAAASAAEGAAIAWQQPEPVTPSSIPLAREDAATATVPIEAATPTPAWTATVRPPNSATPTAATTSAPSATRAHTFTPTATATPRADTATPTSTATPSQTATLTRTATYIAAGFAPPTRVASVTAAPSLALMLPTRRPSASAPAAGPTSSVWLGPEPVTSVAAASPTPSVAANAWPSSITPPALLRPGLEARLKGVVQFDWFPTSPLPVNAYFEVVVWSPEQDPNHARGVAPPRTSYSLTLNLDELFQSGRFRDGNLYWTVLVVEQNPYRRLTQPADSERRYLVLATGG